jgi:cytidine deaminase
MKIDQTMLIQEAQKAIKNAIAPYSHFKVGVALLAKSGKVYTGCNIETGSLSLGICAERVALFKALSEGERTFSTIAITSSSSDYCPPCGACRQVLLEFSPAIEIILINAQGSIIKKHLSELLPFPFARNNLKST